MEPSQNLTYTLVIPSDLDRIQEVEDFTDKVALKMNFPQEDRDSLAIVVTETVNNAIIHGNQNDAHKNVHLEYILDHDRLTIKIKDEGGGFDPDSLEDPRDPKNLLKEGGRGILIVRSLMNEVSFQQEGNGMLITMVKLKSGG